MKRVCLLLLFAFGSAPASASDSSSEAPRVLDASDVSGVNCASFEAYNYMRIGLLLGEPSEEDFSVIQEIRDQLHRFIRIALKERGLSDDGLFAEEPIVTEIFAGANYWRELEQYYGDNPDNAPSSRPFSSGCRKLLDGT